MTSRDEYSALSWQDRVEIRYLSDQYFSSTDRASIHLWGDLWAKEAEFRVNVTDSTTVYRGREEITEFKTSPERAKLVGFTFSSHSLSNLVLEPAGDHVRGKGVGVVTIVYDPVDDGGKVLVRGIHYDDKYIREDGAWRFLVREHQPVWQYETTTVPHGLRPASS